MISIIKFSVHFNKVFQHRGGRWITVYSKGQRVNGKVLKTNPIWATIQRADNQKNVKVWNFKVQFVNADHVKMTRTSNESQMEINYNV